jgi:hypothetical protein
MEETSSGLLGWLRQPLTCAYIDRCCRFRLRFSKSRTLQTANPSSRLRLYAFLPFSLAHTRRSLTSLLGFYYL